MCGILVYKTSGNNFFIQKRGQDFTNKVERNGFTFVHNLLHITGDFSPQPYEQDNIVCIYNGEIYNHKYVKSDGENLIPLYKKYGVDFPKFLDGEWAIALYDFDKQIAMFATDLFATKPIWRNSLECASYQSGVGGHKIPANTIEVVNFGAWNVSSKKIYVWDLNQYKTSFNDWILAFEKAVAKRATQGCFIGLSSGYDSGAIACELLKQKIDFKAYAIAGLEDEKVLKERMALISNHVYLDHSIDYSEEQNWVRNNIEDFKYKVAGKNLKNDSASFGLSKICRMAHDEGRKVYLSGQGADEIIADYALKPHLSTFKGKFPQKLTLWENFYDGCQYSYLGKEEYVAGSHSIETRYPYLDRDLVQEFLWLTPKLKNKYYKAPIHEYLVRNNFPNLFNIKIGLRTKF